MKADRPLRRKTLAPAVRFRHDVTFAAPKRSGGRHPGLTRRARLLGKLAYLAMLNPGQADALRRRLED
jgi:hypothetical protein